MDGKYEMGLDGKRECLDGRRGKMGRFSMDEWRFWEGKRERLLAVVETGVLRR